MLLDLRGDERQGVLTDGTATGFDIQFEVVYVNQD
jgi:hypothetical protein